MIPIEELIDLKTEREVLDEKIRRAEEIIATQDSPQRKAVLLAELMTELESEFRIPLMQDLDWEKTHPDVIRTYRHISDMR